MNTPLQQIESKVYSNEGNEEVLEILNRCSPSRVLDIGCGDGSLARRFKDKNIDYFGITISASEKELALKYCTDIFVHNLEQGLPEPLLKQKFDTLICSHVLEHICQPQRLLKECAAVLTDEGTLVIAIPNMFYITRRLKILMGKFRYENAGLWDNTHYRWYNYSIMKQTLAEAGFEISKFFASGGIPWLCRVPGFTKTKLYAFLNKAMLKTFPSLMGYQLLFIAKRKKT